MRLDGADIGMDSLKQQERVDLHLTAVPEGTFLFLPALSSLLGIDIDNLGAAVARGPGVIATDVPANLARRVARLAAVLNIPLRLVPSGAAHRAAPPQRIDLSVQLSVWADAQRVSARVARMLGLAPQPVAFALSRPGGMILPDQDPDVAIRHFAVLQRIRGLVIASSDPETAQYDLHLTRPLAASDQARLDACLRHVGAREDALTGAVASGLTRALRDHVLTRLPDLGLLAIDRRFQRFDLHLTGTCGWVTRDLADFLVSRTQQPRARFETLSPAAPVTLDLGLRDVVARQFCSDYAAIGLFVRPVLAGRAGNT